jgi:hypothetical protein
VLLLLRNRGNATACVVPVIWSDLLFANVRTLRLVPDTRHGLFIVHPMPLLEEVFADYPWSSFAPITATCPHLRIIHLTYSGHAVVQANQTHLQH